MVTGKEPGGPVGPGRPEVGGQRSEVGDRITDPLARSDFRPLTSDLGHSDPTIGCGNWRLLTQAPARELGRQTRHTSSLRVRQFGAQRGDFTAQRLGFEAI